MDIQTLLNIGISTIMTILGWFALKMWEKHEKHDERMNKLEVELPTHYVRKADMDARFDRLEAKLDMLFERIDRKADK
jgi:hypothetical protein